MSIIYKKVCLIGDFGVGKTSLIRRYINNQFSDQYLSTIGVKISQKNIDISEHSNPNQKLQLMIWDIEGRTKFQAITPEYLQGLHGAIVVADLNRQESIDHLLEHIELLFSVNAKGIVLAIVLNKADLFEDVKLDQAVLNLSQTLNESIQYKSNSFQVNQNLTLAQGNTVNASSYFSSIENTIQNVSFFTTSAKTGQNVEKIFQTLTTHLLESHRSLYYT